MIDGGYFLPKTSPPRDFFETVMDKISERVWRDWDWYSIFGYFPAEGLRGLPLHWDRWTLEALMKKGSEAEQIATPDAIIEMLDEAIARDMREPADEIDLITNNPNGCLCELRVPLSIMGDRHGETAALVEATMRERGWKCEIDWATDHGPIRQGSPAEEYVAVEYCAIVITIPCEKAKAMRAELRPR